MANQHLHCVDATLPFVVRINNFLACCPHWMKNLGWHVWMAITSVARLAQVEEKVNLLISVVEAVECNVKKMEQQLKLVASELVYGHWKNSCPLLIIMSKLFMA
uniref:Uncharacterized protein n=1 Tax=Romanomermis culicivorax TaxID=13658 RepID=A0A915IQM3_ROMCU